MTNSMYDHPYHGVPYGQPADKAKKAELLHLVVVNVGLAEAAKRALDAVSEAGDSVNRVLNRYRFKYQLMPQALVRVALAAFEL